MSQKYHNKIYWIIPYRIIYIDFGKETMIEMYNDMQDFIDKIKKYLEID